jgi:hypothetical protein
MDGDAETKRARLIELMTRPEFFQATVDALPPGTHRTLLRWWGVAHDFYTPTSGGAIDPDLVEELPRNLADEHEVVGRLREVLSRSGVLADLRAQPRSATTDFLLWAAECLGIEG